MFWRWWRGKMEVAEIVKEIDSEFDELVNYIVELVNHIEVVLLKEKNSQDLKKEILLKITISTKYDLEKHHLPFLSKIREDESYGENGKVRIKGMIGEYLGEILEASKKLIYFDDLDYLNHINGFLDTNRASLQLALCLNLYSDLKDFANSGIDEKHYYDEMKSIIKKADLIQKFSSSPITLDKLPKHPTDIIRDFYSHEIFDNCELEIVQKALDNTGAIFKNLYKKKPNATIKEKKIISQFGDMKTYKIKKIIQRHKGT